MLFTIFDVEASGVHSWDDIHSFSYMLADENLDVKRAETLYFWKEGVTKWTEEAYKIHGLTREFLRQYESQFDDNLRKMFIVLSNADLVGYNSGYRGKDNLISGFDYPICKSFLERNGLYAPVPCAFYDVMRLLSKRYKKWVKLPHATADFEFPKELIDSYNILYFGSTGRAHESGYDVVCTGLLFRELCKDGTIDLSIPIAGSFRSPVDDRPLDEYSLVPNADGSLVVNNLYDGEEYSLDDFKHRFPVEFNKIMENPYKYMAEV